MSDWDDPLGDNEYEEEFDEFDDIDFKDSRGLIAQLFNWLSCQFTHLIIIITKCCYATPAVSDTKPKLPDNSIIRKWTGTDVVSFICSMNPEYLQYESTLLNIFIKRNMNGMNLIFMREHHLEYLGITESKHRAAIYLNITKLLDKERGLKTEQSSIYAFTNAVDDFLKLIQLQNERIRNINIKKYNTFAYLSQRSQTLFSFQMMKYNIYEFVYHLVMYQ